MKKSKNLKLGIFFLVFGILCFVVINIVATIIWDGLQYALASDYKWCGYLPTVLTGALSLLLAVIFFVLAGAKAKAKPEFDEYDARMARNRAFFDAHVEEFRKNEEAQLVAICKEFLGEDYEEPKRLLEALDYSSNLECSFGASPTDIANEFACNYNKVKREQHMDEVMEKRVRELAYGSLARDTNCFENFQIWKAMVSYENFKDFFHFLEKKPEEVNSYDVLDLLLSNEVISEEHRRFVQNAAYCAFDGWRFARRLSQYERCADYHRSRGTQQRSSEPSESPASAPTQTKKREQPSSSEIAYYKTFYALKGNIYVAVIHDINNSWAAKQAMLKAYGKTEDDIEYTGGQYTFTADGKNICSFPSTALYQKAVDFDGRNYH